LGVLGALITLITLAVSACGGGSGGGGNHRPEEASKPKPELTTVAGGGERLGAGGPATSAAFCGPTDVALDAAGNIYISDTGDYCSGPGGVTVRKVDSHGVITTVAGTGEEGYSGDGGPATKARLNFPFAVAVDREGNLYISDENNYRIRKVDKEGIITTIAGTGEEGHSGDRGPATSAKLTDTGGIAFDDRGNLYLADYTSVRKIDPSGTITTFAGTGEAGFNREEGPATKVMLNDPIGLFFDDDSGVLYIADPFNARIRAVR